MSAVAAFLAQVQVTATPEDLNVRVVDDGRGGLGLRDLLIPVLAFFGVLVAARMNRNTLAELEASRAREERNRDRARELYETKLEKAREHREVKRDKEREAREDALDQRRAERERDLEQDRERRAQNAEKRRAVGALRTATRKFDNDRSAIAIALQRGSHAPELMGVIPGPSPEEVQLIATWTTPEAWWLYERTGIVLGAVANFKGKPSDETALALNGAYDIAGQCTLAARAEITRLLKEIGDPAASHEWPLMHEYSREPREPDRPKTPPDGGEAEQDP